MVQNIDRIRPPGRNDPCPCGSGKKYKRCCLLQVATLAPVRRCEDVLAEAQAADEEGDLAAAIHILEDARHDVPGVELCTVLVERYLQLPPEEAEPALRQWWEEEHDRFSGAGLARLLIDGGRKEEALHVLNDSRGADAWPEYWRLLAQLRDEEGDTQGAAAAMELYTRVAAENVEAWMTLGDLQLRLGQHERALQSFRRAGDAVPDHILPRMARLRILAEHNRWREARDLAEALLEGHYEDAAPETLFELRDLLARAYFVLGYFDAARRLWESLLTERPDDGEVLFQLASLELTAGRHQRVAALLEPEISGSADLRLLETYLRALLGLHEFEQAGRVAQEIEELDPQLRLLPLIHAAQGVANKEYVWALDQVSGDPPEPYRDLWFTLRLECLAHLGRWQEMWPVLRVLEGTDDAVLVRAALGALAAGKLDLVERLLAKIEDQQSIEARSLSALLGPVRQSRRAAEIRRQQHVDQAERQRWTAESRELRRHIRDLEQHNAALADALALSEQAFQRLLERMGVLADDSGTTWEAHVQGMAERAHKDALARELNAAEQRLRGMLGPTCWERLSEAARASLREGEWLFAAVEGADRDYGASLLEFARGLERAFKDAIFIPARARWQRWPGPVERLQDEGHDPSLGPFVRFVLQGSHLTLGSMAAALDRMSDIRRRGVAVNLLRDQIGIAATDERALADWKRAADRLALAADARNQPAHAAAVSREAVRDFRDLVLGTDGLLHVLAAC